MFRLPDRDRAQPDRVTLARSILAGVASFAVTATLIVLGGLQGAGPFA